MCFGAFKKSCAGHSSVLRDIHKCVEVGLHERHRHRRLLAPIHSWQHWDISPRPWLSHYPCHCPHALYLLLKWEDSRREGELWKG